jgi:tuftelin-interacting protein 11
LLQHVLPPLAAHLRGHFTVNPRKQELEPLVLALAWRDILRPAMLSQLLEAEFVPKWLDALYTWLTARPDFGQVHDWCGASLLTSTMA